MSEEIFEEDTAEDKNEIAAGLLPLAMTDRDVYKGVVIASEAQQALVLER